MQRQTNALLVVSRGAGEPPGAETTRMAMGAGGSASDDAEFFSADEDEAELRKLAPT